jgi:preprotein translocase subunit SecA
MAITNFLKKFFGNKSQRDIKEILPILNRIRETYALTEKLTHDELRAKTAEIRDFVGKAIREKEELIAALRQEVESGSLEIEKVEDIYRNIDNVEKEIVETIEETLLEVLPAAFSIVKETARRFKENEFIEVTATEMDRNLASQRNSVRFTVISQVSEYLDGRWQSGNLGYGSL